MSSVRRPLWSVLVLLALAGPAWAHETRPAYLELRQTRPDSYDVMWKVPGLSETMRLPLEVQLPPDCLPLTRVQRYYASKAFVDR